MKGQISPENTISPDEISLAFAQSYEPAIGRLTFDNLQLKRQVQVLQSQLSELGTAFSNLEQDNAKLIKNHIKYEDRIYQLEAELKALIEAGPTYDQIAAQAKAIINDVSSIEADDTGKSDVDVYEDAETIAAFASVNG